MISLAVTTFWVMIGIAVLVLCLIIAIAIHRISRSLDGILDFIPSDIASDPVNRQPASGSVSPGTLPMSFKLRGSAYRYQLRSRLHRGDDFFRLFEDGPWKWQGQQRFAGVAKSPEGSRIPYEAKINVGHFFAFYRKCAKEEILHYVPEQKVADYALVEVEGELDNLLDLTSLDNVKAVATSMAIVGNIHDIFKDLIATDTGGNDITDLLGYYASSKEYSGILFFSARAIGAEHAEHLRQSNYWDEVMEDYIKGFMYDQMRKRIDRICLAVLSGSLLIRSIKRYRFDDGPWEDNPYHAWTQEALDEKLSYGSTFLAEKQGRVVYIRNPNPPISGGL